MAHSAARVRVYWYGSDEKLTVNRTSLPSISLHFFFVFKIWCVLKIWNLEESGNMFDHSRTILSGLS